MSKQTQPSHDAPGNHRSADRRQALAFADELRRRFLRFHRENPRNTRVPSDLRTAVAAALARGVTPGLLRRTCGLSTSQLTRWRVSSRALAPVQAPPPSTAGQLPPRVFSVIGEATPRPSDLPAYPPTDGLELRLGPWSVCVRLAGPPEANWG
jgi:hypothetical protein